MKSQILTVITAIALTSSVAQIAAAYIPEGIDANSSQTIIAQSNGRQVVESQGYHLEFVPEKTATGMHLDFYLQKSDNHSAVGGAKVTAQVQSPDGKKESLTLKYDSKEKHYTALLASKAAGEYKVAILCDISGKKVNGRFSFKR
jgi:hypothetical protein